MNLQAIFHHPGRIAAGVVAVGLFFAAGSAAGSEGAQSDTTRTGGDVPAAGAADADTLYAYLGTLSSADRSQTIIALNPNVRGALEAIVAGNVAAAVNH